ncbi:hypothetical protein VP01_2835g5 [Puccinia sorghi]|uniref:Uncharacterized protein n=1 Tax=Puccinia sorghi TaxID=27349 RepID=A0A0L6V304_9BASI|nr:hypothetical protein VP01_2835g5 [Puccinia sorghi]
MSLSQLFRLLPNPQSPCTMSPLLTHMRLKVLKKKLMIIEKHSALNPKARIKEVAKILQTLLTSLFPPQSVNISTCQLQKKPGSCLSPRTEFPTRLSRQSMSTTNTRLQRDPKNTFWIWRDPKNTCWLWMLLLPSLGPVMRRCCPQILPPISTIEKASQKGGYLHIESPSGLPAGAMACFSKPELQALGNLKSLPAGYQKGDSTRTSSLSDLESEDQAPGSLADPMIKKSGSQMRLTINPCCLWKLMTWS